MTKLAWISGRMRSFYHAFVGIRRMLRSQHNAWIHAAATLIVIITGALLGVSRTDWCWLILALMAVWTAEALNTAFEFLADVVSPEFHPLVKNAKDVAAGAVLISAVGSVAIGVLVFAPHVVALLV